MPRTKGSPKKCIKSGDAQQTNTWVLLLKGEALEVPEKGDAPDIVQLRHPQSGQGSLFLFSNGDGMLQEVLTFSENKRSWLLDECVKSQNKMHLSTPIDSLFLILPYLRKSSLALPLDQILQDSEFPNIDRLLRSPAIKQLTQIADIKGAEDIIAYKFNEEKTLNWLQRKIERVVELLKQKGIHVGSGFVSATFIKSSKQSEVQESEAYLRYAHGLVSEYLEDELANKLLQHLNLPEESKAATTKDNNRKRKLSGSNQSEINKSSRQDEPASDTILDLTKPEKATKTNLTSKEKARAKAAAGSKSITSFFKKK